MTPGQIETALNFLISKLPEDQMEELDAMMTSATLAPAPSVAQDSARAAWLALGSEGRHAVRQSRKGRLAQDTAGRADFDKRFPDANRLK